jgi:hypothetical protein
VITSSEEDIDELPLKPEITNSLIDDYDEDFPDFRKPVTKSRNETGSRKSAGSGELKGSRNKSVSISDLESIVDSEASQSETSKKPRTLFGVRGNRMFTNALRVMGEPDRVMIGTGKCSRFDI